MQVHLPSHINRSRQIFDFFVWLFRIYLLAGVALNFDMNIIAMSTEKTTAEIDRFDWPLKI